MLSEIGTKCVRKSRAADEPKANLFATRKEKNAHPASGKFGGAHVNEEVCFNDEN